MRTFSGIGAALLCVCAGCAVPAAQPVAAQEQFGDNTSDTNAGDTVCQPVVGQAEIDGTMQQISGIACRQPDGTWLIQQGNGTDTTAVYPVPAYPYYDPWYWGPPVVVGGASFVFVDHFHHFHHMHHVHWGHPGGGFNGHGGFIGHGGFHGGGGMHGSGGGSHAWGGMGGMHGGGGAHGR
ncbi:hypothetical protein [Paraburkholderia diazotrophica]|uniref:hypothetical protein n=1 Tax=Paraburkholderia diazotrophica TaxID=667676 RepID=UPI00316ED9E6